MVFSSDPNQRKVSAKLFEEGFNSLEDKEAAWKDLIKLAQDDDSLVRKCTGEALKSIFGQVPDKTQAWMDLHSLTRDRDRQARFSAAEAIESIFEQIPDKEQAWMDLHSLAQDEDRLVRFKAAEAIGGIFGQAPDKEQAWIDLHSLTQDKSEFVRMRTAEAFGAIFGQVTDKEQAWMDLHSLTQDKDEYVRMYSYHSLGRASILKAIESKDKNTLRKEMQAALDYFEKSVNESEFSPARFCHPFYRSYFAITFQGGSKETIQRYLDDAKTAVGESKSKDELLNAVENLAEALHEAQKLRNRPIQEVSRDLKTYEWYCNQAAMHMTSAEDKAPVAVKLIRLCNPRIKESIQTTIKEIQDIARQICQSAQNKGPEAEGFCNQINDAAGSLSGEGLTETLKTISDIASILNEKCILLPIDERDLVQAQLNSLDNTEAIPKKLDVIKGVFKFFLSRIQKDDMFFRKLGEMDEKIDLIKEDIKSLKQSILDRFELNEQKILLPVFERLGKNMLETIGGLLDATKENRISKNLIEETMNAAREMITEMKSMQIKDSEVTKSLDYCDTVINSPELKIENKIKVTIPIIPLLLSYEGSYSFQTGAKLDEVWKKLHTLIR